MMTRSTIIYGLLIALLVAATPYFTGQLVEFKFKDLTAVVSDIDSLPIKIDVLEYHRHWLKSYAKTRVTLYVKNPVTPQEKLSFIFEHDIHHGPFVHVHDGSFKDWIFSRAIVYSNLLLTEPAKKILIAELGDANLFQIHTEFKIDGAVNIDIQGKPLKLKEDQKSSRVAWQGIQGQWHFSRDLKSLTGEMLLPGFDFDWNGVHYLGQNLSYKTKLSQNPQGIWPGQFLCKVQQLRINKPLEAFNLEINALATTGNLVVTGALADFSASMAVEKVKINNNEYGPISYTNTVHNMDPHFVKSFIDLVKKFKMTPQMQRSSIYQALLSLLPEFLQSRPQVRLDDINIHTSEGDLKGFVDLTLGGPQAHDINQLPQILQSMVGAAKFAIPKALFRDLLTIQYMQGAKSLNELAKKLEANNLKAAANNEITPAKSILKVYSDIELAQMVSNQVNDAISKWLKEKILLDQGQSYLIMLQVENGKFSLNGNLMNLLGAGYGS